MATATTEQDDLQSLIPSLSPIMGSGIDPDEILSSGNPASYMAAMRSGVPFQRTPTAAPAPGPLAAAGQMVKPALEMPSTRTTSPAGTAAVQASPAAAQPSLAAGLAGAGQVPATNAPNPATETTNNPTVPGTVTPTGTPQTGAFSRLSSGPDSNAIESQLVAASSPQSAANPTGVPMPRDPNHPEYKPSAGRRIIRGLVGAGEGLAEGGLRGALLGGLDPARTSGVAYGAPTRQFSQAAQRNAMLQGSLNQELQQAPATIKSEADKLITISPDEAIQMKSPALAGQSVTQGVYQHLLTNAQTVGGRNTVADTRLTGELSKQGLKQQDDGTIVPDTESPVYKSHKVMDDLRAAQTEDTEAQEELRRSQSDPNSPAFKLAQQRAETARANAGAAQERANAYMLNAYGANLGTNPFNGAALPGSTVDTAGTPMGSRFQSQFSKHEGAAAQFNDVGGALDGLETAARAMVAKGQQPNNAIIATALSQPEGTARQWLQGNIAKANLTPEQREYVINLVSARENLQALRKAGGLPGSTEAQVDRLMEMLPNASTPDLDYFLRQTGQIKQTRDRLAAGIPNVTGGTAVRTSHSTAAPARPANVPADFNWNAQGNGGKGSWQRPKK